MEKPPECLNMDYKLKHKVLYSKVMNQLNNYRLKTVFLEALDYDDDEFCEFEWKRMPSINSTSYEILCLIHDDRKPKSKRWGRPYGGVL